MIKLFLIDDHPLILDGLKMLINNFEELHIIGEAHSIETLLDALVTKKPDILILDIKLKNDNSLDHIENILKLHPYLKIILFSSYNYPALVKKALSLNVNGYLLKDTHSSELIIAIKTVYQGKKYIGKKVNRSTFFEENKEELKVNDPFLTKKRISKRELEVIRLIVAGLESKNISEQLFISINTVKTHRKNILKKLKLKNSGELIKFVLENDLLGYE